MGLVEKGFSSDRYRYGFNGKENDNEIKGEGNQQDYGFRIYDPRIGKFLSVDPITAKYPELTPYQFASNTPIWAIDLDGLEAVKAPGNAEIIWNFIANDNHITRAKQFAAARNIDASQVYLIVGSRASYVMGNDAPPIRNVDNTSVIIYDPVENPKTGEVTVFKHVFRQTGNTSPFTLSTSSSNDNLFQLWDLDFDESGQPIPNESDRSETSFDSPFSLGGKAGKVGTVVMNAAQDSRSWYKVLKGPLHHIATNKNFIQGLQWSKKFEPIFKKAGYGLDDALNKVFVPGHRGPHPEAYHRYVYNALLAATRGKKGKEYKTALEGAMKKLATDAQKAGSKLNKLLTGN
ncbi:AHH domain-containing protein [Chitinophaga sp. CB10]|uniref:AHH domain-containing protein n=1 Tax=Chitinophaga sp. CB10 TaxID=1891659 RepID=UPI0025BEA80D|nr:AHH domain-containing protein [Chitinophaga sp. CB10]